MRRSVVLGLIAAAVATVVYLIFFRSSDESRIRERLDQLAEAVRIDEEELSPLPRAARIRSAFAEIFTEDARATVAELDETLEGRHALGLAATQLRGAYQSADVSFDDVKVRIDGNAAKVSATATVTGAMSGRAASREEMRVSLELTKIDGEWRIVSAVVEPKRAAREPGSIRHSHQKIGRSADRLDDAVEVELIGGRERRVGKPAGAGSHA